MNYRGAALFGEHDRMKTIRQSLEEAWAIREIPLTSGGVMWVRWCKFETVQGQIWGVERVEQDPDGETAHISMRHQNGYEIAEVVVDLRTNTITSAEISETVKHGRII